MEILKQMRQWICWNIREKNGRKTKVPCAPACGATGTNIEYAHTWVTWHEAVSAMQHHGHTGVGFVIPQGYFFLDVDHKDISDPLVQMLLNRFNSYAEHARVVGCIPLHLGLVIQAEPLIAISGELYQVHLLHVWQG